MDRIEIKDFTDGAILREADFRERVAAHDWSRYDGRAVLIQGCSDMIIPTWAFLVVTARLVGHADRIYFGEQMTRIPIHQGGGGGGATGGASGGVGAGADTGAAAGATSSD